MRNFASCDPLQSPNQARALSQNPMWLDAETNQHAARVGRQSILTTKVPVTSTHRKTERIIACFFHSAGANIVFYRGFDRLDRVDPCFSLSFYVLFCLVVVLCFYCFVYSLFFLFMFIFFMCLFVLSLSLSLSLFFENKTKHKTT